MKPTLPRKPTRDVDKIAASWLCRLLDCVEYAMNFPQGDGKSTYRNGGTIHGIDQSGNSLENESETGDAYNGYFKVIQTDTNKIKVVYGYDESAEKCGYATINDLVFEVDAAELTITGNAFIYLQSVATQSDDDWVAQTPTIKQSASFPTYEENKYKRLLANVYFSDNAITKIIQQQHGPVNGDTSGEC
ncbi:MAG: hypothetical protein PHV82_14110 [Victivallaceae bacterium]|nr:hypothetical protein [Victivallaceae bacterium]